MSKNVKFFRLRDSSRKRCLKGRHKTAFTLVEMLAVMGIIVVMLGVTAPLVRFLKGAGDLTKGAADIAGVLEKSRAYAMANNTYVFVGFCERDGADISLAGSGQILMVTMVSRDGTQNFGPDNSNLTGLSKLTRLKGMRFEESLPNQGTESRPEIQSSYSLGSTAFEGQNSFVSNGYQFSKIIQFDSRGTAVVQTAGGGVPQWVEIGLADAEGTNDASPDNWAALVLDGVTGSVRIFRP